MKLELTRTYFPEGTNGELLLNGERVCSTIELPWKNNRRNVSCIPEGSYAIAPRYTARFGKHFVVQNVPGRSAILLHAANDALKEIRGCIAPVLELTGPGTGIMARTALARIVELVYPGLEKGNPIYLTIQSKRHE
jgi:Family of unknown function (DUF5675)